MPKVPKMEVPFHGVYFIVQSSNIKRNNMNIYR